MAIDPQKMAAIMQRMQLAQPGGAGGPPPDGPPPGMPPQGGPPPGIPMQIQGVMTPQPQGGPAPGMAPRPMMPPGRMPPR